MSCSSPQVKPDNLNDSTDTGQIEYTLAGVFWHYKYSSSTSSSEGKHLKKQKFYDIARGSVPLYQNALKRSLPQLIARLKDQHDLIIKDSTLRSLLSSHNLKYGVGFTQEKAADFFGLKAASDTQNFAFITGTLLGIDHHTGGGISFDLTVSIFKNGNARFYTAEKRVTESNREFFSIADVDLFFNDLGDQELAALSLQPVHSN